MTDGLDPDVIRSAALTLVRAHLRSDRSTDENRRLAETLLVEEGVREDPSALLASVAEVAAAVLQASATFAVTMGEEDVTAEAVLDVVELGLRAREA